MIDVELTDPHHVTAGYVGVPGERVFYVQAEGGGQRVDLLVEKEQVRGLGQLIARLLARLDDAPATDWDRAAMELREPIEPRWRAGDISVAMDPDRARFLIELEEFVTEQDEADDPRSVRIWIDQDQARRLAAHTTEVVDQGRPRCQLCGRPMETTGEHVCPATNGHGRLTR